MKKLLLCLMVVMLSVTMITGFALTGCKTTPAETTETIAAETTAAETTEEPVVGGSIRVLDIAGPEADLLVEQKDAFEEETGIEVTIDLATRDDASTRFMRELMEGAGTYDVCIGSAGGSSTPYVYKANYIPIEDYLTGEEVKLFYARDNYTDPSIGKLSGIPQYQNCNMLFYRKDLLNDPKEQAAFKEKYGRELTIPTTPEELFEVCEFFNRPPDMYGYMVGGVDWSSECDYAYFLFGEGGNYGDRDGNMTLDTPEAVTAMENLVKFAQFGPPGWEASTFFDADELMLEGKLFAYQNWGYIWNTFQAEMPDNVGMAVPVGVVEPGVYIGTGLGLIPESAPNPDLGAEFLKWVGSYDVQKDHVLKLGNLPGRSDVMEDPEVREALVGIEEIEEAIVHGKVLLTSWGAEMATGINEAFFKVVNGEMTAAEAMKWLQEEKFADRKAIE